MLCRQEIIMCGYVGFASLSSSFGDDPKSLLSLWLPFLSSVFLRQLLVYFFFFLATFWYIEPLNSCFCPNGPETTKLSSFLLTLPTFSSPRSCMFPKDLFRNTTSTTHHTVEHYVSYYFGSKSNIALLAREFGYRKIVNTIFL